MSVAGINVLLHALSAALLFFMLKRATGYAGRSFMVAALFALHPLNVEAVAWIAERKTVLSMLFFLLALGVYDRYARQPKESRYWLVALLFALGLTAKAQVITLPLYFCFGTSGRCNECRCDNRRLPRWDYLPFRKNRCAGSFLRRLHFCSSPPPPG